MVTALPYIIKAQICFAAFWIAYRLLFAGDKAFARNRAYLLLLVAAAFIVPALSIPVWMPEAVGSEQPAPYNVPDIAVGIPGVLSPTQTEGLFERSRLPYYIACAGSLAMLLALSVSGFQLWRITRRAALVQSGKIRIYRTGTHGSAFSFFNRIYIDDQKTKQDIPQIVAHEMHHVKLRHSWDILLSSVLRVLFWWNPFVWLWERSLREVHEFQADAAVLNNGFDSEQYITLILEGLTVIHPEFVSGFSYSLIKKRLIMISQNRQKRLAKFRILLTLPLTGLLMVCFSFTEKPSLQNVPDSPASGTTDTLETQKTHSDSNFLIKKSLPHTTIMWSNYQDLPDFMKQTLTSPLTEMNGTNGKPLAFVDGMMPTKRNPITIVPEQIDSVIYKTGKATEAYGTDGRNGVILIKTKQKMPLIKIRRNNHPNLADALAGRLAGLAALQQDSTSGTILSGTGAKPLIIIDGKEVDNIKDLDPNNVASVSVLKDAAAIAIYGVKGQNGVLMIKTKTNPSDGFQVRVSPTAPQPDK